MSGGGINGNCTSELYLINRIETKHGVYECVQHFLSTPIHILHGSESIR